MVMVCWKLDGPFEQVAAGTPSHLQHGQFRTPNKEYIKKIRVHLVGLEIEYIEYLSPLTFSY
jgi:hypothetical protein